MSRDKRRKKSRKAAKKMKEDRYWEKVNKRLFIAQGGKFENGTAVHTKLQQH